MDDIASFLRSHPPFSGLDGADLAKVAESVEVRPIAAGEVVLVEDGPPSNAFYVTAEGSMELVHEDAVIDLLEPGEGFGHTSLLSGLAPSFTVRAHEDSVCLVVPRDEALLVLGRLEGAGYVARSLRARLVRTGHTAHGMPELATVRIGDLVPGPPVYCEPGVTITHAAEIMTHSGSSAVLIRSGELQIVTDADIRAKAVGGPISPQNPVIRIAERAVVVEPTRLAVDAAVEMLDRGADHVVVASRGGVLGVVSSADLMGLQTRSPFALRHSILHARDEDELVAASRRLGALFLALLHAGVSPADIGRVLTLQYDALTIRLVDLAVSRHGPLPVPWAWLALGSSARRELTLGSDQENALAYAATADRGADAAFEQIASDVTAGLVRCGFPADANGVLASAKLWRMSLPSWEKTIRSCFTSPDRSHLIRATVALDFRQVTGGLEVVEPLVAILREGNRHPDFLRRLARTATDFKPPLGFRGAFATGRSKDAPTGTIDLKRGGMLPIVNLARFHALANEVTISATLDRLVAVEELGKLPSEEATALREAFSCVWRIRLAHHAARIASGAEANNDVDPTTLPPLEREELREALRAIVRAQKRLDVYVPSGI